MVRSGGERQRIDHWAVFEEADEVVAGAMTASSMEATVMTEGEWENRTVKRSLSSMLLQVPDQP